jgi:hypothetical protein
MVHHYLSDGTVVRVVCCDIRACTTRQDAQAATLMRTSGKRMRAAGKQVA